MWEVFTSPGDVESISIWLFCFIPAVELFVWEVFTSPWCVESIVIFWCRRCGRCGGRRIVVAKTVFP